MGRRDKSPGAPRRLLSRCTFALFRLLSLLPARPTVALFGGIGSLAARMGLLRHRVVRGNLDIAFGDSMSEAEKARVERAAGGHLFMLLAETIFLANRPAHWARECIVEVVGAEHLQARIDDRAGAIAFGGHFGNWEVMGAYLGSRLHVHPIAKELHDPIWQERTLAMRRKFGLDPIHVGPSTLKQALEALRAGRTINFLIDQDMGPEGLFVPFLGRPASTMSTPAALAIRTGCRLYPGFIVRLGPSRHRIEVKPPIDPADFREGTREERIAALTARMTREIEDMVRAHPAQYFWVHRRWRTTPESARKRLATLAEKRERKLARRAAKAAARTAAPPGGTGPSVSP